jgi:hypothetical protein
MTRTPFDQLSKQYLEEFLEPLGKVERQYEVPGEAKYIDVWFVPNPESVRVNDLGLLGQMAQKPSLFEPYRDIPSRTEVRVSVMKLVWVQEDERRKAHKEEIPEDEQPVLWILAASTSQPLLDAANVIIDPAYPTGVYFTADIFKTAIVAIDQLPESPDTLLLRVLGRGRTQKRAIEEVLSLPANAPRKNQILRLVASWKVRMDISELTEFGQQEEIMAMTEAFLTWEQETKDQAQREGQQQERRSIALNLLRQGISIETIVQATGLTAPEIQALEPPMP